MKFFKFFMVLAVCLSPLFASAQDVITLKSGDEIQAKVTEVGQTEVKYKRFDNPDGPTYTVNKSDIFMVKYQNGQKDVFKDEQPAQNNVSTSKENDDDGEFWELHYWTNQRIAGISLFADLGGFGFTGPRAGLEFRYRRFWANAFYKYGSIGAMNSVYLDSYRTDDPPQGLKGNGVGFTVKFLFPFKNSNSAMHIGVINEWGFYSCYFDGFYDGEQFHLDWDVDVGSTGLGLGYSYHIDKGFYFTLGGYFGVSVFNRIYENDFYDPYSRTNFHGIGSDNWVDFFGIAEVTLGWEFCLYRKK